ncbi:MAG: hypothetical protein KGL39_35620 [Patescibacteria group bacterium]|nr:hypothetical protein [Patescibacteria group bacterium]
MHIVPRAPQQFIRRYGGVNPYGAPNWNLIVASDRLVKESGVYRDWAEGLSTAEKGGFNFEPNPAAPGCNFSRYGNKPIRVVTEMREVRKYPHAEGWILERWFPASSYGTPEEWYSYKAVDGVTPMLGPYPERGAYEMLFGPWPKVPSTDVLQAYISSYASNIANRRGTPESRAQEYLLRYKYEEELAERRRKEEYAAWMTDELSPMNSLSLEASRWRQDLAKRTGNANEHVGVINAL